MAQVIGNTKKKPRYYWNTKAFLMVAEAGFEPTPCCGARNFLSLPWENSDRCPSFFLASSRTASARKRPLRVMSWYIELGLKIESLDRTGFDNRKPTNEPTNTEKTDKLKLPFSPVRTQLDQTLPRLSKRVSPATKMSFPLQNKPKPTIVTGSRTLLHLNNNEN